LEGNEDFFQVTKHPHHVLHGQPGDGQGVHQAIRSIYEQTQKETLAELQVGPGDVVVLHEGAAMDPTRKLYRSKTNRQVAGVWCGLAEHFNVDATLIRVLFVVLAVLGGSGLLLYVAMWIIIPKEP
jgi:phage shock protein C